MLALSWDEARCFDQRVILSFDEARWFYQLSEAGWFRQVEVVFFIYNKYYKWIILYFLYKIIAMKQVAIDIKQAIQEHNGIATLQQIYELCPQYSISYIRQQIQSHSSDTNTFPKYEDIFFTVNGLGSGVWGLRDHVLENGDAEVVQDVNGNEHPRRQLTIHNRVIRDTALANQIKILVNYSCQLCGLQIELPNNQYYIEAHHIMALIQEIIF